MKRFPFVCLFKKFYWSIVDLQGCVSFRCMAKLFGYRYTHIRGFPDGSAGKEFTCDAGDTGDVGSIPGSGRPPRGRTWQPTPVFLPGESHGLQSLVGYSPKGHTESDTTE